MSMTGRSRRLVSALVVVLVLGLLPTVSTAQVWSTFLGGSTFDQPNAIRLDPAGDLLVAGSYADPSQADGPCSRVMLTPTTFVARCVFACPILADALPG